MHICVYECSCMCAMAQVWRLDQRTPQTSAFTSTLFEAGSLAGRWRHQVIWPLGFQRFSCFHLPFCCRRAGATDALLSLAFTWALGTVCRSPPSPQSTLSLSHLPNLRRGGDTGVYHHLWFSVSSDQRPIRFWVQKSDGGLPRHGVHLGASKEGQQEVTQAGIP